MLTWHSARRQRGLSVVEMMVGVAIGLLVVAAASLVVSGQLVENRRLIVETQVQQDLRAAADIITRELRRAGHWNEAATGVAPPAGTSANCNRYATLSPVASEQDSVAYRYYRSAGADGPLGFKIEGGVLKSAIGSSSTLDASTCTQSTAASNWQELTDARTLKVTELTVTPVNSPLPSMTSPLGGIQLPCPKLCADGTRDCWPTLTVRELVVKISGEAANDPSVRRSIRSTVRLRNDWVQFNDSSNATRMCPA